MKLRCFIRTLLCLTCTLPAAAAAQKLVPVKDAPGTRDYQDMPRYEGSTIVIQSEKKFGDLALQIGGLSTPVSTDPKEVRKVEGRVHRTTYVFLNAAGSRRSALEVARNYQLAVKDAGFTMIWSGDQAALRNGPPQPYYNVPELDHQLVTTGVKERNYFCAEKSGLFAAVYVSTRSWDHKMMAKSPANLWKQEVTIPTDAVVIQVDLVDTRPMEEKMVQVSAAEMQKSIDSTGKVALYGIYFDFNKADLKAESDATLTEIAGLLKANPALKVLVVGHTDNVGEFAFNKDLSERRAAAVAAALSTRFGIATERLTPLGASFMAPVATNRTEEGRALNRRVELVAR